MTGAKPSKTMDDLYIQALLWDISRKYEHKLLHYISTANQNNECELFMNFDIVDFKPKHRKFGRPIDIQRLWLAEVVTKKIPAVRWDAWNNGMFTVHFKW